MNRNVLKFIAMATMLIDHVGWQFFPQVTWLRAIGRISMPIFAFFVAQGLKHTRSREKYLATMLLFACVTQIPYIFLSHQLNILFTFAVAMVIICLIENLGKSTFCTISLLILLAFAILVPDAYEVFSYGFWGISLVVAFYLFDNRLIGLLFGGLNLLLYSLSLGLDIGTFKYTDYSFYNLLSLIPIALYNGKKGELNLKYLFYIFYPAHLLIIVLIKAFI